MDEDQVLESLRSIIYDNDTTPSRLTESVLLLRRTGNSEDVPGQVWQQKFNRLCETGPRTPQELISNHEEVQKTVANFAEHVASVVVEFLLSNAPQDFVRGGIQFMHVSNPDVLSAVGSFASAMKLTSAELRGLSAVHSLPHLASMLHVPLSASVTFSGVHYFAHTDLEFSEKSLVYGWFQTTSEHWKNCTPADRMHGSSATAGAFLTKAVGWALGMKAHMGMEGTIFLNHDAQLHLCSGQYYLTSVGRMLPPVIVERQNKRPMQEDGSSIPLSPMASHVECPWFRFRKEYMQKYHQVINLSSDSFTVNRDNSDVQSDTEVLNAARSMHSVAIPELCEYLFQVDAFLTGRFEPSSSDAQRDPVGNPTRIAGIRANVRRLVEERRPQDFTFGDIKPTFHEFGINLALMGTVTKHLEGRYAEAFGTEEAASRILPLLRIEMVARTCRTLLDEEVRKGNVWDFSECSFMTTKKRLDLLQDRVARIAVDWLMRLTGDDLSHLDHSDERLWKEQVLPLVLEKYDYSMKFHQSNPIEASSRRAKSKLENTSLGYTKTQRRGQLLQPSDFDDGSVPKVRPLAALETQPWGVITDPAVAPLAPFVSYPSSLQEENRRRREAVRFALEGLPATSLPLACTPLTEPRANAPPVAASTIEQQSQPTHAEMETPFLACCQDRRIVDRICELSGFRLIFSGNHLCGIWMEIYARKKSLVTTFSYTQQTVQKLLEGDFFLVEQQIQNDIRNRQRHWLQTAFGAELHCLDLYEQLAQVLSFSGRRSSFIEYVQKVINAESRETGHHELGLMMMHLRESELERGRKKYQLAFEAAKRAETLATEHAQGSKFIPLALKAILDAADEDLDMTLTTQQARREILRRMIPLCKAIHLPVGHIMAREALRNISGTITVADAEVFQQKFIPATRKDCDEAPPPIHILDTVSEGSLDETPSNQALIADGAQREIVRPVTRAKSSFLGQRGLPRELQLAGDDRRQVFEALQTLASETSITDDGTVYYLSRLACITKKLDWFPTIAVAVAQFVPAVSEFFQGAHFDLVECATNALDEAGESAECPHRDLYALDETVAKDLDASDDVNVSFCVSLGIQLGNEYLESRCMLYHVVNSVLKRWFGKLLAAVPQRVIARPWAWDFQLMTYFCSFVSLLHQTTIVAPVVCGSVLRYAIRCLDSSPLVVPFNLLLCGVMRRLERQRQEANFDVLEAREVTHNPDIDRKRLLSRVDLYLAACFALVKVRRVQLRGDEATSLSPGQVLFPPQTQSVTDPDGVESFTSMAFVSSQVLSIFGLSTTDEHLPELLRHAKQVVVPGLIADIERFVSLHRTERFRSWDLVLERLSKLYDLECDAYADKETEVLLCRHPPGTVAVERTCAQWQELINTLKLIIETGKERVGAGKNQAMFENLLAATMARLDSCRQQDEIFRKELETVKEALSQPKKGLSMHSSFNAFSSESSVATPQNKGIVSPSVHSRSFLPGATPLNHHVSASTLHLEKSKSILKRSGEAQVAKDAIKRMEDPREGKRQKLMKKRVGFLTVSPPEVPSGEKCSVCWQLPSSIPVPPPRAWIAAVPEGTTNVRLDDARTRRTGFAVRQLKGELTNFDLPPEVGGYLVMYFLQDAEENVLRLAECMAKVRVLHARSRDSIVADGTAKLQLPHLRSEPTLVPVEAGWNPYDTLGAQRQRIETRVRQAMVTPSRTSEMASPPPLAKVHAATPQPHRTDVSPRGKNVLYVPVVRSEQEANHLQERFVCRFAMPLLSASGMQSLNEKPIRVIHVSRQLHPS